MSRLPHLLHLEASYKKSWLYKKMVGSSGASSAVVLSQLWVLEDAGWGCECTNLKNLGSAAVILQGCL